MLPETTSMATYPTSIMGSELSRTPMLEIHHFETLDKCACDVPGTMFGFSNMGRTPFPA